MSSNIEKLYKISLKETRTIIGLMSGTSLDGLDIALCSISKNGPKTELKVLNFETVPYSKDFKNDIFSISSQKIVDLQELTLLNAVIGSYHGDLVLSALSKWNLSPKDIDLIASHGQTVYHCPKTFHKLENYPNATLQIGDGDHIAVKTGIITVSDFRQKNIASGSEGAPLALYGDTLLFYKKNKMRILLNIGGIANFTLLDGINDVFYATSTDTGPGNTLIDNYARLCFNLDFDKDAKLAKKGTVNLELLRKLKSHDFFSKSFPKTTGREEFFSVYNVSPDGVNVIFLISTYDTLATITELSAQTIAEAIRKILEERRISHEHDEFIILNSDVEILVSGGGAHNPLLMERLKFFLGDIEIKRIEEEGSTQITGDNKEAVLFALLANEMVSKKDDEESIYQKFGLQSISMGKISFPT